MHLSLREEFNVLVRVEQVGYHAYIAAASTNTIRAEATRELNGAPVTAAKAFGVDVSAGVVTFTTSIDVLGLRWQDRR